VSTTDPDSARTALLDACTLIPIRLTAVLLWLAEAGLFEVLWSDAILDEVERNLPKVGISSEQAARRVGAMRRGFGAAALVDDFEHLIPDMMCDAKDRHVLAAAVRGGADTLVTFNRKDFPPDSTDGHGIKVVHPDLFLVRLPAERPNDVVAALERGTAALRKPAQTMREFLASLTPTVPMFAREILGQKSPRAEQFHLRWWHGTGVRVADPHRRGQPSGRADLGQPRRSAPSCHGSVVAAGHRSGYGR
jgi:predicted nucleic acid-binding protein